MKNINAFLAPFFVATCIFSGSTLAEKNHDRKEKVFFVEGKVTTGFNVSKNKPMYDLGGILGGFGFQFVFAYEPNRAEASIITAETDDNTLLATGVDQNFYGPLGIDTRTINPDALNVPLRNIPVILNGHGPRSKLEPISSENYKKGATLSSPAKHLTVADWYRARGTVMVTCSSPEKAQVQFKFSNLIPNGVYTVWGLFGTDANQDGVRDGFVPLPFGGVPHVFTVSDDGHASFERNLPFCPNTDKDLMTVEVAYQADGTVFGAAPAMFPTLSNVWLGIIPAPSQLSFNFGLAEFK